jgi:hypothetical protein
LNALRGVDSRVVDASNYLLQAHCPKEQRAVVTSNRNTLRSLGAAVSLAVSGALLANTLRDSLPEELQYLANDSFAAPDLRLFEPVQRAQIKQAYAAESRAVFIWSFVLIAISLGLTMIIKDSGLARKAEEEGATQNQVVGQCCQQARQASRSLLPCLFVRLELIALLVWQVKGVPLDYLLVCEKSWQKSADYP